MPTAALVMAGLLRLVIGAVRHHEPRKVAARGARPAKPIWADGGPLSTSGRAEGVRRQRRFSSEARLFFSASMLLTTLLGGSAASLGFHGRAPFFFDLMLSSTRSFTGPRT